MAWIAPTLQTCKDRIPKEWPSLSSAAKAEGQDADELAQKVIDLQVNRIRGRVPQSVARGSDGTIPDELESSFFALWVYEFINKLPKMKSFLDENRVRAYESAMAELKELSMGRINVVPPITVAAPNEQAVASTVGLVTKGKRRMSRDNLGGLF